MKKYEASLCLFCAGVALSISMTSGWKLEVNAEDCYTTSRTNNSNYDGAEIEYVVTEIVQENKAQKEILSGSNETDYYIEARMGDSSYDSAEIEYVAAESAQENREQKEALCRNDVTDYYIEMQADRSNYDSAEIEYAVPTGME